jgi:hypothetical protein
MWEYGKPPDVVIEIVSNRRGGEDSDKLQGYAQIRIPYYAIFDPERMLSDEVLRIYELHRFRYRPLEETSPLPGIGLGLQLWHGVYEDHDNTWLRWVDADGQLIATGGERAEKAQQQAEQAQRQAEHAEQRADKLAEQLRQLGVEPEA